MKIIKNLRYFHIDAVFYFLGLVSTFMSLALTETHTGQFMIIPLITVSCVSISVLSLIHCCEGEEDYDDIKYSPIPSNDYE
jgi:hypothetical protein